VNWITWIIVGIIAGWLAGVITRTDRGILGDLVLGLLGAIIAGWIVDGSVGGDSGFIGSIIAATIAAVVLVFLKNWILGRNK
jgi:uncharacterized membrane protein YeaQ/YmgE (transglycosylase-associated protein family)